MVLFMRFIKKLLLVVLIALGAIALSGFSADPTDDFSFHFARSEATRAFGLMSEEAVASLLADRLDLRPRSDSAKLARHLVKLCRRYRFDPAFVLSVIEVESGFRVGAVSPQGAVGLMQLIPSTAERVAERYSISYSGRHSLHDPFTNTSIGVAYLSFLREKYRSLSPYFHIAAYNVGPGRIDELISQGAFKPVKTKRYYDLIRERVSTLRFYRKGDAGV
jgi:soluble lytic murein transglycosylase-like protein